MKSARSSLALSRPLLAWLQQDPAWQAQPAAWRWRQRWLATLGSLNGRLSELQARDDAPPLDDPILVIGPWRSGTTVMHELLTAATGLATPRTWQCMDPCAFRLTGPGGSGRPVARPMDGLPISSRSPQEDEFALLALGVDSAYRAFWMPHRLHQIAHTLDASYWLEHPQWLAPWEAFLRGVLAVPGDDACPQPLILKSPNHSYRIRSILQRFPKARLVWMARDPVQVLMSNRKMWSAMFATHGLTQPVPGALDDFLRDALDAAAQTLAWCADKLPPEHLVVVAHEALLARPADVVDDIGERLQLPRASSRNALHVALDHVRRGRVERYSQATPAPAEVACSALAAVHRIALASRHAIR